MKRVSQDVFSVAYQGDEVQGRNLVKRIVGKAFVAFDVFVEVRQLHDLAVCLLRQAFGECSVGGIVSQVVA